MGAVTRGERGSKRVPALTQSLTQPQIVGKICLYINGIEIYAPDSKSVVRKDLGVRASPGAANWEAGRAGVGAASSRSRRGWCIRPGRRRRFLEIAAEAPEQAAITLEPVVGQRPETSGRPREG